MIWEAIKAGFEVFGQWQLWVACLSFVVIFMLVNPFFGYAMLKSHNEKTAVLGCAARVIIPSLIQVVFISILIVFILPMLMGGDEFTPFSFISEEWWRIVKAGFLVFLTLILIAFIPIIGDLVINSVGISILVIGIGIFHKIAGSSLRHIQELNGTHVDIKPDMFKVVGFIFFAWAITAGVTLILNAIFTSTKLFNQVTKEWVGLFLATAINVIAGLFTLAVYISYVLLKIKNAV